MFDTEFLSIAVKALEEIRDFNESSNYDDPGQIAVEALNKIKQ